MNRCWRTALLMLFVMAADVIGLAGDDDRQSQERLKLMEQEVAQFAVHAPSGAEPTAFRFAGKPLLRYSDPTRGLTVGNVLMDATVWRLGEQGRPRAILTQEIYRVSATEGVLSFEFLSLSPEPFSMRHKGVPKIVWEATDSALKLSPLPDAPEPATTPSARLLQMRRLVKRFAVRETLITGEQMDCRLMPQPIDRYQAPDQQIADGALFTFANGTNPEIGVLLESDGKQWSYGVVRLSAAEVAVLLDDRVVAKFSLPTNAESPRGNYVSNNRRVRLPQ